MAPVYVDTNILIAFVEKNHAEVMKLFELSARGHFDLLTSQLSLAEVMVRPLAAAREDLVRAYRALLTRPLAVRTIPITTDVLMRSASVRAENGGKLPDAIHVATALETGCKSILSSDQRLRFPASLTRISEAEIIARLL
ncbi:type II toxin-antitoxin system VapC family toxin [Jiella avicenniae]|uniref:Ribonuclease VapC n=1 Tax=Jiella avicenniae TaxID=2907202 RepID=A0A9X1P3K7_9HYPH|nr:type II toxin-antitoxin system VapC family toxin [Jiella avicenniae]